jgi:prepilin-type N-terminal cleavage/methylation domain-containing protein
MSRTGNQASVAGVTLLELLVAVAILATISGLLYGTFTRAFAAREYSVAAMERYADARSAIDWLEDDLEGSFGSGLYPSGAKRFFSPGMADTPTLGDAPLLDVTTTSARGTTALVGPLLDVERPRDQGDQVRVLYHLEEPDTADRMAPRAGLDLVRYEFRPPLDVTLEEASRAVVAHGIASIQLRFFDGGAWHEDWDTTTEAGAKGRPAPKMVRIRVRLADPAEPAELISSVRLLLGGRHG